MRHVTGIVRDRKIVRAAVLAGLVLMPTASGADLRVCNQTLDVANVALGQWDGEEWETSGWWTVGPNQCATLIEKPLSERYYYVYARDVFNKSMLEGDEVLCIDPDEFRIRRVAECLVRGHLGVDFKRIDTRQAENWTVFLQAFE